MITCTIVVPHINTPFFLEACLNHIERYRNPNINHDIIVVDQSAPEFKEKVYSLCRGKPNIRLFNHPKMDAGYPIDLALTSATGEFFCSLDCDAMVINKNWLLMPIELIKKHNFSFVGCSTGLHNSYSKMAPTPFFHINNFYRVSRTVIARKISLDVGFMRIENRDKVGFTPKNDMWRGSCDNGVVAQWYSDYCKLGPKLSLKLNSYTGRTNEMGLYGFTIDDMIYHFVFGFGAEWITDMIKTLGPEYLALRKEIETNGISFELIEKLVKNTQPHPCPREIDGNIINQELTDEIERLKNAS
jgi:hypothetical protein